MRLAPPQTNTTHTWGQAQVGQVTREVLLEHLFYVSLRVLILREPIHKFSMLREMNRVVNGSIVHRRNISYGRTSD
jgi:hypothetical protein